MPRYIWSRVANQRKPTARATAAKVLIVICAFPLTWKSAAAIDHVNDPLVLATVGLCGSITAKWLWEWVEFAILEDWKRFRAYTAAILLALLLASVGIMIIFWMTELWLIVLHFIPYIMVALFVTKKMDRHPQGY